MHIAGIYQACAADIPHGSADFNVDPDKEELDASPIMFRSFTPLPKGKGQMIEWTAKI